MIICNLTLSPAAHIYRLPLAISHYFIPIWLYSSSFSFHPEFGPVQYALPFTNPGVHWLYWMAHTALRVCTSCAARPTTPRPAVGINTTTASAIRRALRGP